MFLIVSEYWNEVQNRRKVFEEYAKEYNFDAYRPSDWYSQPVERIINTKVLFYLFYSSVLVFSSHYYCSYLFLIVLMLEHEKSTSVL